jgi:hypothetical protein
MFTKLGSIINSLEPATGQFLPKPAEINYELFRHMDWQDITKTLYGSADEKEYPHASSVWSSTPQGDPAPVHPLRYMRGQN